jgi:hypothetical protein
MTHISFGVHKSGRVIDAVEAVRGLACECTCPVCGGRLLARKGEVKAPHFAHHDSSNCVGAAMTALHLAAQQLIVDAQHLALPPLEVHVAQHHVRLGTYQKTKCFEHGALWVLGGAEAEVAIGFGRRADVVGDDPLMGRVAVEVRVTHEVDADKARDLVALGIPCVEVNLQEWVGQMLTMATLAEQVLERRDNRTWVHHPRKVAYERQLMEGYPTWVKQREAEEAARERELAAWEAQRHRRQAEEAKARATRQASFRRHWGDAYKKAVEALGLECRRLHYFIDKTDFKGAPFCVEGKVWRAVFFAAWIHGRTKSAKADAPIPSDADMAGMLGKRLGASEYTDNFDTGSATRAVRGYLSYLSKCGIIEEREGRYYVRAERPAARPNPTPVRAEGRGSSAWASVWPKPALMLDRLERFAEEHQLVSFDAPLFIEELLPYQNQTEELSDDDLRELVELCGAPRTLASQMFKAAGVFQ